MTKTKSIPIYVKQEEKEQLKDAAEKIGLKLSTFCKSSAIKESRKIINEVKKESQTDE